DTLFLTTTVALVVTLDNRVEIAVADWVTVLIEFSAELLDGGGRVDLHQSGWGLAETLAGGRVAEGSSFTVIVDQSTQRANLNILARPCFLQDNLVVGVDDVTQFVDREVILQEAWSGKDVQVGPL